MNILFRIWPWSEIRRLKAQLASEREFGDACLFYLNEHVDGDGGKLGVIFIRCDGKLYFMDANRTFVVEKPKEETSKA